MQAEPAHVSQDPTILAQAELKTIPVLVVKRDGTTEPFNKACIALAIESAFKAVRDIPADEPMTSAMSEVVNGLTEIISKNLLERAAHGASLDVEYILDSIENQLMCDGYLTEARRFIFYREDRRKLREQKADAEADVYPNPEPAVVEPVESVEPVIEKPSAASLLKVIYTEVVPGASSEHDFEAAHRRNFSYAIQDAVHHNQLAQELLMFDLEHLSNALCLERDELIGWEGLEWLYGNCFARERDRCVETPQYFWMRLAMALAAGEQDGKEDRALEFYEILSTLRFVPSEKLLRTVGRSSGGNSRGNFLDSEDVQPGSNAGGHLNVAAHMQDGVLDELLLYGTISSSVRWLDNAVEKSQYRFEIATQRAREYREIELGIIGFDKAFELAGIPFESKEANELVDRAGESVAYYATLASALLAAERGSFAAYDDSNWTLGMLPFESLKLSQGQSGGLHNFVGSKDWVAVRAAVRQHGIRNSRLLAFTPANVIEKLIGSATSKAAFATELNRLVRCRGWVDGGVWITLPDDLVGAQLQQALGLLQQLGLTAYMPPVRVTISEPFIDAAAASKVLKGIEKSA